MTCNCCKGKGVVLDIMGEPRPCTRCRPDADFQRWYQGKLAETDAHKAAIKKPKAASGKRRKRQ